MPKTSPSYERAHIFELIPKGRQKLYVALQEAGATRAKAQRNVLWTATADDGVTIINLWRRYVRITGLQIVAKLDSSTWARLGIVRHKVRAYREVLSRVVGQKVRVIVLEESEPGSRRSVGAHLDTQLWTVSGSNDDFILKRDGNVPKEWHRHLAFTDRMLKVYEDAKQQIDYRASRFRQKVIRDGGVEAAKYWLKKGTTEGFQRLWDDDRLDLSVEAVVLEPEWVDLFTADELEIARYRLAQMGHFSRVPLPDLPATDFAPDEADQSVTFSEGLKKAAIVNAYERNPVARRKCIEHYGVKCYVCGFDFLAFYGEVGRQYIQVHHLLQLSLTDGEVRTDPVLDLRPVCPNCHAMLHRRTPPLKIGELQRAIRVAKKERWKHRRLHDMQVA